MVRTRRTPEPAQRRGSQQHRSVPARRNVRHSSKHTALCVVKTLTDFEGNRVESQRPEVNFIMEYRLYDGTLKMRATGYILWALCARTGSVDCRVPLWSAGGMISVTAIHWQLHVMKKKWERW